MGKQARKRVWQATGSVVAGLVLGFVVGWWLWPVEYTNTTPGVLRQDYRDDYVVMVATAYQVDGDLERARQRLALLNPEEPAAPVVELANRLIGVGGSAEDINRLARLARTLGTFAPTLVP